MNVARKSVQAYFILVGKYGQSDAPYELIFGDYVRGTVEFEKEVTNDYVQMRIVPLTEDNQLAVSHAIRQLNDKG